ncbi:MAG TPA: histidine--tRNA ligase [Calditrichaeota bacterium]|nr:histidine--tRNA ligase [Calditrichota bacterium]
MRRIKGTQDIIGPECERWVMVETAIRRVMRLYNFNEIRTPVFEATELFARGIGQLTDIVSKEMYTFVDRGKKQITLKPEMTAPVVRAYVENKLYAQSPVNKLFYISPLFRQENPQAGRLRQFHQFGAEILGTSDPYADVETILLAFAVYDEIGIQNLKLRLNSVGDAEDRPAYKQILQNYIQPHLKDYCPDCQRRFESNPMRILDCKNEACTLLNKNAPKLAEHLGEKSRAHYRQVKDGLQAVGLSFEEDPYLVRGLDYYTHTVFEITSDSLGAQNAICGGGRYDYLAEELGGNPTPAVGFASGIERLLMVADKQDILLAPKERLDIFLAPLGDAARRQIPIWQKKLRSAGFKTETDFLGRSLKAQMREANRQQARFVLLLGEDELSKKVFSLKIMDSSEQREISFEQIISTLQALINKTVD